MKTPEEILYRKISVKDRNPDKYGEYNTDKGLLYWLPEHSEWSCRDDRLCKEYPMFWYEECASQISEEEIQKEGVRRTFNKISKNVTGYIWFVKGAKWYKQQLNK